MFRRLFTRIFNKTEKQTTSSQEIEATPSFPLEFFIFQDIFFFSFFP